jgi:two-component system sensor histidine kinase BarA
LCRKVLCLLHYFTTAKIGAAMRSQDFIIKFKNWIGKGLTANSFYLNRLKFEDRKKLHYLLLSCIILLQLLAVLMWYNESKLSQAHDEMSESNKMLTMANRANGSLIRSQQYFNDYLNNNDAASLAKYSQSVGDAQQQLDSMGISIGNNKKFKQLLGERDGKHAEISKIRQSIDSIIGTHSIDDSGRHPSPLLLHQFEPGKILDNIKTDYYLKVDSASKKGLFSRLADAFSGKVSIQKEYLNTVVKMHYKDKVTTGNVEQQIANTIALTNEYYEQEFARLRKSFSGLRAADLMLMQLNNKLLQLSLGELSSYNDASGLFAPGKQQLIADRYGNHKIARGIGIVILILLMLVISLVLFSFTRVAFEYEKRLADAQQQIQHSLNFKNRITGMISHEIRSPLSILSIYSEKAGALANEPELKEIFRSIVYTTNSLLLLSNQILEYSKDENRKMELRPKEIQLKAEMEQILYSMLPLVESKGNILEIHSNLEPNLTVYADIAKIYQVFYNVVGNANKFTQDGSVGVSLHQEILSDYEVNLKVTVTDNGWGIAKNDLENIFEAYYQGIVSDKVNDLGVGLGLNICKEIIELFGGEITIESQKGKGTKVSFNLVLAQV